MSESASQDAGEPKPPAMHIDRYFTNLRWSMDNNKKSSADIDFSMNGGLLEFLKSKSKEGVAETPDAQPLTSPAENSTPPPTDPPPWMKCCGRNFKSSIFSLQPAEQPKRRSFSRIPSRAPNGHLNSTR